MGSYESPSNPVDANSGLRTGPVDAVLFEAFPDERLSDLAIDTAPDGSLLVSAPDRRDAVRLEVTERGLTAEQVLAPVDSELRPVERVEPSTDATARRAERRRQGD